MARTQFWFTEPQILQSRHCPPRRPGLQTPSTDRPRPRPWSYLPRPLSGSLASFGGRSPKCGRWNGRTAFKGRSPFLSNTLHSPTQTLNTKSPLLNLRFDLVASNIDQIILTYFVKGRISVKLTSCSTCLHSAALLM